MAARTPRCSILASRARYSVSRRRPPKEPREILKDAAAGLDVPNPRAARRRDVTVVLRRPGDAIRTRRGRQADAHRSLTPLARGSARQRRPTWPPIRTSRRRRSYARAQATRTERLDARPNPPKKQNKNPPIHPMTPPPPNGVSRPCAPLRLPRNFTGQVRHGDVVVLLWGNGRLQGFVSARLRRCNEAGDAATTRGRSQSWTHPRDVDRLL